MTELWPENSSIESFEDAFPVQTENLYRELFFYFRSQIKVQREEPAIRNLAIIFRATFKLSSQKGFHAMSLRDLSSETNISMGGLYNYISCKEDLAGMIVEFLGSHIGGHIYQHTAIATSRNIELKLDQTIRALVYTAEIFQPWFFFMFMEAKNMSPGNKLKAKEFELRSINNLSMVIAEYQAAKPGVSADPLLASSTIIATVEAWYLKSWHYTENKITITDYADYCVALTRKLL